MMTISEAVMLFTDQLKFLYSAEEAKELAFYVIRHECGISRSHFLANRKELISEGHSLSLIRILDELKTGRPVQYILGETEFYGLRLNVNSSVLIPRSETEELVEWILNEQSALSNELSAMSSQPSALSPQTSTLSILDIGTGSGCIAIALKKNLPVAEVCGLDISAGALETAKQNALLNNVEIGFLMTDILKDPLPDVRYSLIVSNPPYVTNSEKREMHVNVTDYEPHSALFVADDNALIFYEQIADFAKTHLIEGGSLFFEINENLGEQTSELLRNKGFEIELRKDMRGKDRMIRARLFL